MGIGVSIFLIAVGAILAFAVNAQANGIDIQTVGWIVLAVGIIGLVLSMIFWSSWAGPRLLHEPAPHVRGGRPGRAAVLGRGPRRSTGGGAAKAPRSWRFEGERHDRHA